MYVNICQQTIGKRKIPRKYRYRHALVRPIQSSEMKGRRVDPDDKLTPAMEAIGKLLLQELNRSFSSGQMDAMSAHAEIKVAPISQRTGPFYRNFAAWLKDLVSLLAESYRRYFKLALAHPRHTGRDPHGWAWRQLQPALLAVVEWIRDWYILACEGENQYVRHVGSTEFVPGQTVSLSIPTTVPPAPPPDFWRPPAWLFEISPLVGVGPLKTKHVPARDSEERLDAAHTRLLLKGARRVLLWQLGLAVENVRNEETAAAGSIPAETVGGRAGGPKRSPKGFEGLGAKVADLSKYMHFLTHKQQMAFSLKFEYELGPTEIASRMGIDRKTVSEHLDAADRRIKQAYSSERRKAIRAKNEPD